MQSGLVIHLILIPSNTCGMICKNLSLNFPVPVMLSNSSPEFNRRGIVSHSITFSNSSNHSQKEFMSLS